MSQERLTLMPGQSHDIDAGASGVQVQNGHEQGAAFEITIEGNTQRHEFRYPNYSLFIELPKKAARISNVGQGRLEYALRR